MARALKPVLRARLGELYAGDCLEVMPRLPAGSVDMVLCDLPYGVTKVSWDSVIPLEPLWAEYRRLVKPTGVVVLTAAQPFTTALINSNPKEFRYCWYWMKSHSTMHMQAKRKPMRRVEEVVVFYRRQPTYHPPDVVRMPRPKLTVKKKIKREDGQYEIDRQPRQVYLQRETNWPDNVLVFDSVHKARHATQKPLDLFKYLINTYTERGDVVLDNAMGSGTTALAAEATGRRWVGVERDEGYLRLIEERLRENDFLPGN